MYCPKCSQSQVSAEVRFCSRCGFPLVAVGELLMTGGVFPVHAASGESVGSMPTVSPRRRGVKRGVALLLVGIFLLPFFAILHEALGLPQEFMVLSAIVVMAAVMRLIYAAFVEDGAPHAAYLASPPPPPAAVPLYAPPQTIAPRLNQAAQEMLPPAQPQVTPVNAYRQPHVDTSEILHPPSVTDHTTRLLEKSSDSSER